jgi:hypothetical protein
MRVDDEWRGLITFVCVCLVASGTTGDPAFGCPETRRPHPEENFSCQDRIFSSLLTQTLINPVGSVYIYSDLRFGASPPPPPLQRGRVV